GAEVIKHIAAELQAAPDSAGIPFDVVIIGAGPAGLSAALTARQLNLRFVGVEQQQVLATIESFGKNKYVHFKPAHIKASGGLVIEGKGQQCAQILVAWKQAVNKHKIMLNPPVREECAAAIYENERCTNIERGADGDYLIVTTERPREARAQTYRTRRVVLAIGQRGAPLKLNNPKNFVPGEDLSITRK